jgi:hypothetical protein
MNDKPILYAAIPNKIEKPPEYIREVGYNNDIMGGSDAKSIPQPTLYPNTMPVSINDIINNVNITKDYMATNDLIRRSPNILKQELSNVLKQEIPPQIKEEEGKRKLVFKPFIDNLINKLIKDFIDLLNFKI